MPYNPEEDYLSSGESPTQLQEADTGANGKSLRIDDFSGSKNNRKMLFTRCWFYGKLAQENISQWTFYECAFDQSSWEQVKFSRCTFRRCHFYKVSMAECSFMDSCVFEANSASPETLILRGTQINPESFLGAIKTNLDHLPGDVSEEYQRYRLHRTKANLARLIFFSTKDEPSLEIFGDAQKQLIIHDGYKKIDHHRFHFGSTSTKPQKTPPWRFWVRSIPARIELYILRVSGFLTSWGKSLTRPMVFFLSTVLVYAFLYFTLSDSEQSPEIAAQIIKALNVTLVAGYTSYFEASAPVKQQALLTTNLIIGLFWYSLIVPVVVRRVLR